MRSSSIIIFFFLGLTTGLFAQGHSVTGTVRDAAGQGVPYAGVVLQQVQDTTKNYYTGASEVGNFVFDKIPPSRYTMKVSAVGYSDYDLLLDVQGDTAVGLVDR